MMTSLAALTLEIYYRYLPLFKAEVPAGGAVVAERLRPRRPPRTPPPRRPRRTPPNRRSSRR